jgi:hypothetical protein
VVDRLQGQVLSKREADYLIEQVLLRVR